MKTLPKQLQESSFNFIPLRGKDPSINGLGWQKHIHSYKEVNTWLLNKQNYGIMGGHGGLIILDADTDAVSKVVEKNLPATFTVKSGSGKKHFYFICPEIEKKIIFNDKITPSQFKKGEDHYGEIITWGFQAVGPGSIHPDTKKYYEVYKDVPIIEISKEEIFSAISEFLPPIKEAPIKSDGDLDHISIGDIINVKQTSTIIHPVHGAKHGGNLNINLEKNVWRCFRCDSGGGPLALIAVLEGIIDCSDAQRGILRGKKFKDTLELAESKYHIVTKTVKIPDDLPDEEKEITKEFAKNKTKATYNLAKYLTHKFNIITVGEKEREIYVYKNGVYFLAENEIIFPEIQRILGEQVNKSAKLETFHKIADMTSHPRSIFSSAPFNFIPLTNGVYDMNIRTLLSHSPEYRFTYQFPIIYDSQADCPKTKDFMNQILSLEQQQIIQEWLGFYFYRLYIFKKAIIFVGEGDTGKTTFLEVITYLLGRDNLSSVSLQKMTSDRFSAAHLYSKHANIVDELSAKDIHDTGNFKIATGGGSISGEYKYGNQFSFHNFSKFTFACNKIPDVTDFDDEAYFNRWMVIRFENPIINKLPNFIATLTTEEERSGLFNYAMEGLERLLKEGTFTYKKSAMDTKREMMRSGSSIAKFSSEMITQEAKVEITKEDMYDAYSQYCIDNGYATETIKMFGTKFLFYVPYATEGLITVLNHKGRPDRAKGWRNVRVVKETTKADKDFDEISANDIPL